MFADIFGCQIGLHLESGLADAASEFAFAKGPEHVKSKWNNLERSCSPNDTSPKIYDWLFSTKLMKLSNLYYQKLDGRLGLILHHTTNVSNTLSNQKWNGKKPCFPS